jgi:hypothetical protein
MKCRIVQQDGCLNSFPLTVDVPDRNLACPTHRLSTGNCLHVSQRPLMLLSALLHGCILHADRRGSRARGDTSRSHRHMPGVHTARGRSQWRMSIMGALGTIRTCLRRELDRCTRVFYLWFCCPGSCTTGPDRHSYLQFAPRAAPQKISHSRVWSACRGGGYLRACALGQPCGGQRGAAFVSRSVCRPKQTAKRGIYIGSRV